MDRLFIIEFDYFKDREEIFNALKIIDSQSINVLTGFNVFINNIASSLEFYVHLSYDGNPNNEVNQMKELLFSKGVYRPDISLDTLFDRASERGFNSYGISSLTIDRILETEFFFKSEKDLGFYKFDPELYKEYLKQEGYLAVDKIEKGTSLFLSHSSKQKEVLENVIPYLVSKNELVWIDKYRINASDEEDIVKREIAIGLNKSNKVLFYITSDFLQSNWCNFEIEISYDIYKEKKNLSLFFIIDKDIKQSFKIKYSELLKNISPNNVIFYDRNEDFEKIITNFKTLV